MKYLVRCKQCGRIFAVNEVKEGSYTFYCPSCGNGVHLILERMNSGNLFPVVECSAVVRSEEQKRRLPVISKQQNNSNGLAKAEQQDAGKEKKLKGQSFLRMAWTSLIWFLRQLWHFAVWSYRKIQAFRSKYKNADLWLFFVGSVLFILLVILGLMVCAKVTIWLADFHSWLFKLYLKVEF